MMIFVSKAVAFIGATIISQPVHAANTAFDSQPPDELSLGLHVGLVLLILVFGYFVTRR